MTTKNENEDGGKGGGLTVFLGLPLAVPNNSMFFTVLAPSITSPNTTCLSSSHGVCLFRRSRRTRWERGREGGEI